ncbi:MAG: hypothetical protein AAGA85_18790 [Bacteroidota bacterium]
MDGVQQQWLEIENRKYLSFQFIGHLTDDVAKRAIAEWQAHFDQNIAPLEKAGIVWNCLEMTKYSPGAALSWKNALPQFNSRISEIWLITTNPFFKMGARTVTMLTSFKLNVVSSDEEFRSAVGAPPV